MTLLRCIINKCNDEFEVIFMYVMGNNSHAGVVPEVLHVRFLICTTNHPCVFSTPVTSELYLFGFSSSQYLRCHDSSRLMII